MGGAGHGATVKEEGLPDPFSTPSGPPCSTPQAVHWHHCRRYHCSDADINGIV